MNKHTIGDLYQMQSLPLSAKIQMTQNRINQWVEHYGENGVFVAFSGGKDSTVLLDIARKMYAKMRAVYTDTGLEYPEVRAFVQSYENVEILRPKLDFRQTIIKYGYPFISKEVADCVYGARQYVKKLARGEMLSTEIKVPIRYQILTGKYPHKEKGKMTSEYSRMYNKERYKFFLEAPLRYQRGAATCGRKHPCVAMERGRDASP